MASPTQARRFVILALVLATAGVLGVMALVSRSGASDMPGMDMSAEQMPKTSPTPAAKTGDMPGMDMPAEQMPKASPTPAAKTGDMPGMDMSAEAGSAEPPRDRPLAPVLGTFAGGSAAVMLSAGMMRRRDRLASQVKAAARAARRGQK